MTRLEGVKTFWSSPCQRCGLSTDDEPFPCLGENWGARECPMNAARAGWLQRCEDGMYRLGYPYAAWVVKEDGLGCFPVCSLEFFRDEPTPELVQATQGPHLLRVEKATPAPPGQPAR
jgi:hypothetical protein